MTTGCKCAPVQIWGISSRRPGGESDQKITRPFHVLLLLKSSTGNPTLAIFALREVNKLFPFVGTWIKDIYLTLNFKANLNTLNYDVCYLSTVLNFKYAAKQLPK